MVILVGSTVKKAKLEDDLQILQEIPGKSGLSGGGMAALSGLLGSSMSGGSVMSGASNPFFNPPSILQAQDPYFALNAMQPGSSSAASTVDLLQKCKLIPMGFQSKTTNIRKLENIVRHNSQTHKIHIEKAYPYNTNFSRQTGLVLEILINFLAWIAIYFHPTKTIKCLRM